MKKKAFVKLCYILALVLSLVFAVRTVMDGARYSDVETSAPFYAYVILNAVYFLLPAALIFLVGWLIKRKNKR